MMSACAPEVFPLKISPTVNLNVGSLSTIFFTVNVNCPDLGPVTRLVVVAVNRYDNPSTTSGMLNKVVVLYVITIDAVDV